MNEQFSDLLRARGYRMTAQRLAILRALQASKGHLTPQAVFEKVREADPGVTEATVYRTLNFLTAQGLLLAAHVGSGQLVYELASHAHHHLICRRCGATCEVDHALLRDLYRSLEARTGFQIDTTHVTFFGLCPQCGS